MRRKQKHQNEYLNQAEDECKSDNECINKVMKTKKKSDNICLQDNAQMIPRVKRHQSKESKQSEVICISESDNDSLKRLVTSMIIAAERNTASNGRRQTRSCAIRQVNVPFFATKDRRDEDSCYDLEGACIGQGALL